MTQEQRKMPKRTLLIVARLLELAALVLPFCRRRMSGTNAIHETSDQAKKVSHLRRAATMSTHDLSPPTTTATVERRIGGSIMKDAVAPHHEPQKTESQIDHWKGGVEGSQDATSCRLRRKTHPEEVDAPDVSLRLELRAACEVDDSGDPEQLSGRQPRGQQAGSG